ncbi:MAG: PhnD/SsuA/transferrin family substrate-binding protein [Pseudomonadota bacterium]
MIATLPMYDWPEERATVDAQWATLRDALRAAGLAAPDALTRSDDLYALWRDPDLILGQTCGLPYVLGLHETTQVVGAVDPGLPDTPAGHYRSVIIARADDPRDPGALLAARVAVNEPGSQSGWGALAGWAATQDLALSGHLQATGAHRASAGAVAQNRADIAAIDAVSWALITRHDPATATALRIVARTAPTPAPPLISAARFDPDQIAAAIAPALGLGRLVRHSRDAYFGVPRFAFPG